MPKHIVVDGSNLATEGRSMPSLKQLSDAVEAYLAEHPTELVTVVVDATFGHRIDPREVAEFEEAIDHNELVAPPAGAVGRGDAFILAIANKVNAIILSNDSFQEFHGDYPWLFDEGRLVGGKPVPHVGWVFVERVPVRGPLSRKSTREARTKDAPRDTVRTSAASSRPMPVPKAPPPRSVPADAPSRPPADRSRRAPSSPPAAAPRAAPPAAPARNAMVNDLMPFLEFVEKFPVGTLIDVVVETYSSHGAYVEAGGARAYLPLRNIADPAPRSARELFKLGETVTVQVAAFHAARRGIDLAIPGVVAGLVAPPVAASKPVKGRARKVAAEPSAPAIVQATEVADTPAAKPARRGRGGKQATVESVADVPVEVSLAAAPPVTSPTETTPPAKASGRRRSPSRAGMADMAPPEPVSAAARSRRRPSTRDASPATTDATVTSTPEPVLVPEPVTPPAPSAERAKPVRKSSAKAAKDAAAKDAATKDAAAKDAATKDAATKRVGAAIADVPAAVAPAPAKPVRRAKASTQVVEAEPAPAKPAAKRSRSKA